MQGHEKNCVSSMIKQLGLLFLQIIQLPLKGDVVEAEFILLCVRRTIQSQKLYIPLCHYSFEFDNKLYKFPIIYTYNAYILKKILNQISLFQPVFDKDMQYKYVLRGYYKNLTLQRYFLRQCAKSFNELREGSGHKLDKSFALRK